MRRWILISLAVAAGLLAGTAPAGATTVNSVSEYLEITGDPGNVNDLRLRHDLDRQVLRIEDSVPIARRNLGGPACTAPGPTVVECPYPPAGPPAGSQFRFFVELGDRDDRLLIDAPRVSPEIYVGAGIFTEVADGPGNDRAISVPTTTTFRNGPGNDVLRGAARATAGAGHDTIFGTVGPDNLDGGAGRDLIRGREGRDVLRGGLANDRLFGEGGQDRLFGGPGADLLRGGPARDGLFGGPGRDTTIQS